MLLLIFFSSCHLFWHTVSFCPVSSSASFDSLFYFSFNRRALTSKGSPSVKILAQNPFCSHFLPAAVCANSIAVFVSVLEKLLSRVFPFVFVFFPNMAASGFLGGPLSENGHYSMPGPWLSVSLFTTAFNNCVTFYCVDQARKSSFSFLVFVPTALYSQQPWQETYSKTGEALFYLKTQHLRNMSHNKSE